MRAFCGFLVTFGAILIIFSNDLHAASPGIVFTKIADTNTPIPEGTGNFPGFGFASIDGRDVAFSSTTYGNEDANLGIYVSRNGRLEKVVNKDSAIPGASRNFGLFGPPVIKDGEILFYDDSYQGVFLCRGEETIVLADNRTVTPPGSGYVYGSYPSRDGNIVVFPQDVSAIYKIVEGRIEIVADTTTVVPGKAATFSHFACCSMYHQKPLVDRETIVFMGGGPHLDDRGIYAEVGGVLQTIVDSNTPVPDEAGYFRDLYMFDMSRDVLTFLDLGYGIYRSNDGLVSPVVKAGDSASCGVLELDYGSTMCMDSDVVAFQSFYYGVAGRRTGLFAIYNDQIVTVAECGDILDGKEVLRVYQLSQDALSGNNVVFHVHFQDMSEAIYVATLPDILVDESFPSHDPNYGFFRDPNGGSAEVIVDPENAENGVLRLYDPGDNYVSITKRVELYPNLDTWFRYKFNTDGKLEVILRDWQCSGTLTVAQGAVFCRHEPVTIATIKAPESGPGRDSFATFSYSVLPDAALANVLAYAYMEATFELRLSNDGDPELLLDDVLVTTTDVFIKPPPPGEFTGDEAVAMDDFAFLAGFWNKDASSADIAPLPYGDGRVDALDLAVFAEFWLEGIE